jgi:hypothetical protein
MACAGESRGEFFIASMMRPLSRKHIAAMGIRQGAAARSSHTGVPAARLGGAGPKPPKHSL